MKKFKSLKTYQRLQEDKVQDPVLTYSNRSEIGQTFSEFSHQYRQSVFPDNIEHKNQENGVKIIEKHHSNIQQPKLEDNLSGFLDHKFKAQLQKNMEKENAVVKMFGNALIATVFQSLVLRTVESLYKIQVNVEADIPISSNILKAFGISPIALNSFKSTQDKVNYILSCMDKTIEQMFTNFQEKIEFKEKKQEEQDKKELKKSHKRDQNDNFPWLKVKTQYESLRKRMNTCIIEKLNDYENLVSVLEKLKEKQELKKEGKFSEASKVKYVLKNTQETSTEHIFQNMSKFGNPKVQQFLSRLGVSKESDQLKTFWLPRKKDKNQEKEESDSQKEPQNEQLSNLQNFWSAEKEEAFKKNRQDKKQLYSNEVTSSSWNSVGFLPFVQEYFIDMKKSMQRDHLLDRYAEGEWLTAEELKLLANTSELLNSCIDKKFMQNAVDIIQKDVILDLELGLAEDILKNYDEIQIGIKRSRQTFIQSSLEKSQKMLRAFEEKRQRERQAIKNEEFHHQKRKTLTTLCYKLEREGKFIEKPPENVLGAEPLQEFLEGKIDQDELVKDLKNINFYVDQLESKDGGFKDPVLEGKKAKKLKEQQQKEYFRSISLPKQCQDTRFIKSVIRHSFHPPSKVFVADERATAEFTPEEEVKHKQKNRASIEANKSDLLRFKLPLKANYVYKNQGNFYKFYSGGPPKPLRQIPFYNPLVPGEVEVTPSELKSIIAIQKFFRKHKQEKRIRQTLENIEKDKQFEYKHKIDQIRHLSKQQFRIIPGESIQDLKIITGDDADRKNQVINNASQSRQLDKQVKQNNATTATNNMNINNNRSLASFHGNPSMSISNLNTTSATLFQNTSRLTRPVTGKKEGEFLTEANPRKSDMLSPGTPTVSKAQLQRPKTANQSNQINNQTKYNQSSYTSRKHSGAYQYDGSLHYPQLFLTARESTSEFKKTKEQLHVKPIEKQLRNVKLLESAINNQFWALNTGHYVFSKRDLHLSRDKNGWTALHWVTYHKNVEFIQWLINQGSDPNAPDNEGNTPIHIAFKTNKFEVVLVLIHSGGDLNSVNLLRETPLGCGSEELLKTLKLTEGVKAVASHTSEQIFDNNQLLPFLTQDEITEFREKSYFSRFENRKLFKAPSERLRRSWKGDESSLRDSVAQLHH